MTIHFIRLSRSALASVLAPVALVVSFDFAFSQNAPAKPVVDAPSGFAWSQSKDMLPDPSSVIVDGNITRLTYRDAKLPRQFADADSLVLRLCDGRGLQQVRWFGRAYPQSAAVDNFLDFYEQVTQRNGQADQYEPEHASAAWTALQSRMRLVGDEERNYRIVVIYDGPQYADCRAEHDRITARR
jgi:hypothetical protein